MLTLGIPTLNRYDLLEAASVSAETGSLKPDRYLIIDNGMKFVYDDFYTSLGDRLTVLTQLDNLGVAGSWNKICASTPDIRLISNDDIIFFPDTIEKLVRSFDEKAVVYPAGIVSTNAFSCFIIPDKVLEIVGYFDESISPGYGYFEDNDYHRRMIQKNIPLVGIPDCKLVHHHSSTLKRLTDY